MYKTTKFQFIVSPRPIWNPLVESCADFNMGTEYVTSIRAVGAKVTEKPSYCQTRHTPRPKATTSTSDKVSPASRADKSTCRSEGESTDTCEFSVFVWDKEWH